MSNGSISIGIDIGGTNTSFGMVNRRGDILFQGTMKTLGFDSVQDYINALFRKLEPSIKKAGKEKIIGMGIGAPNANFYTGEIAYPANLPWKGITPFAKLISERFGFNATITNDANAAALGEMIYGAARGMKDFIMVTLGTGVGSGFVVNGQLIYGHDGFAGELGHITAIRGGRKCGCGRYGCLETYASATGIVRSAKEWLEERSEPSLLRKTEAPLSAHAIFKAAEKGDAFALQLFDYTGKILGQVLADAVAITSPEAIVFFGGLAKAGSFILDPAKKYMEENLLKVFRNKVRFIHSAFSEADAAILGASALAWG